MRRSRAFALVALPALVAAACTAGPSGRSADAPRPASTPPSSLGGSATAPASAAPTASPPQLDWSECGTGLQCATLRVPLDRAAPAGRQVSLALVRLPASGPGQRLGSLVVNPGGPGGSGVDYARGARSLIPEPVRRRFDIVGFDPRGVGASTAVDCLTDAQLDAFLDLDPTPDTPAEQNAVVDAARQVGQGCAARDPELLPHLGTADTARDLDDLRAALGDDKLTFLGKSYGTFLGATYAEMFPTRVRALVLDGALDPSLSEAEFDRVQALGFEQSLTDFLGFCAGRTGCGLGASKSVPDLLAGLDRILARLEVQPLRVRAQPTRPVGPGRASYGIAAALYSRASGWPALDRALQQAATGDGSGLLALADAYADRDANGHFSNQLEAQAAIGCLDRDYPPGPEPYLQQARELAVVAPHFGPLNPVISSVCGTWPAPPTLHPHPVRAPGSPPILVVGTTGDPATPYVWAQALAAQLEHGTLLTYQGEGHTVYGGGRSGCIDAAVDAYLLDLRLPAPNTTCSS